MSESKRSPIKDKPLRTPGQSLEEERRAIWDDKVEPWVLSALFLLLLVAWEWLRYFHPLPTTPWVVTVCAIALMGFAAWRFLRLLPTIRQLRQGAEGEKAVGQFLERLRGEGYQVFHDIVADGFNIDHVLIGPAGVFTVETKTWSKPMRGDARVSYDGTTLLVAGWAPDRNPVVAAKSQARWLKALLADTTGRQLPVRPVVVVPGWYVEATPGSQREVWVMEPKGLPAFLGAEDARLEAADVKLAAFHLGRFIRSVERERAA